MAGAFVASAQAEAAASSTTIAVSPGTNPTAGNLLWVVVRSDTDTTCTVADSLGNTFTPIGSVVEAGTGDELFHFYAKGILGGADTITATFGAAQISRGIYVEEWSGLDSNSPLVSHHEVTDTGNNPTTNASNTNGGAAGVLLSFGNQVNGTPSIVAGSGMTARTAVAWSTDTARGTAQYRVLAADTNVYTSNFANSTFDRVNQVAAIFKEQGVTPLPQGKRAKANSGFVRRPFDITALAPRLRVESWFWQGWWPAPAAAAGAYSLTAEQATFNLSGQAVGLRAGRKMAAAQGSLALTGQAAGLRKGYPLVAQQGSYSLSGQTVALRAARTMVAAQGAFTLTGQAVTLRPVHFLAVAQGAYSQTGQAAALRATRTMAAAQGSYSLSGQATAIRAARNVAAAQGSYSLTGYDAALTYSGAGPKTITANQGSFTLSGQAAGLRAARTIAAALGTFAFTGQDAALRLGRKVAAAQGSFSLTGQNATLSRTRVLVAQQGAYSLNGQATGLRGARRISISSGGYTLTGTAVTLFAAHRLPAASGSYSLAGQAALLRARRTMAAAYGTFAISGQEVVLNYSGTATPISPLRIYGVRAENRAYTIPAENRTYNVLRQRAGNRTYLIPDESRSYAIRRENRTRGIT